MQAILVAFLLYLITTVWRLDAEKITVVDDDGFGSTPKDDVVAEERLKDVIEKLTTQLEVLESQPLQASNETSFCNSIELQASGLASSFADDGEDHGASWAVGEVMREITWLCEGGEFRSSDADFKAHAKGMHEVLATLMDSMQCHPGMVPCGKGGNVVGQRPNCTCACQLGWAGENCSEPVCAESCGAHGFCIGPNTCKCAEDWVDGPLSAHIQEGLAFIQETRRHFHHHHHRHTHHQMNRHSLGRFAKKPATEVVTRCSVQLKYTWGNGSWGECNATERGKNGSQTRPVACRRSDGVTLQDIVTECTTARCAEGCSTEQKPNTTQDCCLPLRKEDFPDSDCGKEEDGCGGFVDFGPCMAAGNISNASSRFEPVMKLLKGLLLEAQEELKKGKDNSGFCKGMERKVHGFMKQIEAENKNQTKNETNNGTNSSVSDTHLWALNEVARELEWLCHSDWTEKPVSEQKRILKAHKDMLLEVFDAYVEAQNHHIEANKDTVSNATKYLQSYWDTTSDHDNREPWKSLRLAKRRLLNTSNSTDYCRNLTSAACGISAICNWDEDERRCKDPHEVAVEAQRAQEEANEAAQDLMNVTPAVVDMEPDFLPPSKSDGDQEWWPENLTRTNRDGWKYTPWGREEIGGPEERKSRMEEEKREKKRKEKEERDRKKKAKEEAELEAELRKKQRPPECPPCACGQADPDNPASNSFLQSNADAAPPLAFLHVAWRARGGWRGRHSCPKCDPCPSATQSPGVAPLEESHLQAEVQMLTSDNHELRTSLASEQQAIAGLAQEVARLREQGLPSDDPRRAQAESWRNLWSGMNSLARRNPLSMLRRMVEESHRDDVDTTTIF